MILSDIFLRGKFRPKGTPKGTYRYRAGLIMFNGANENACFVTYTSEKSQEEADNALVNHLRNTYRGDWEPKFLEFRGERVFCWRTPTDCAYGFIRGGELQGSTGGFDNLEECERYARRHLAHIQFDGEELTSPIITNKEDQKQFMVWSREERFRRRMYKRLGKEGLGYTNNEVHNIMGPMREPVTAERRLECGDWKPVLDEETRILNQELREVM
jgi:hypothetical protein